MKEIQFTCDKCNSSDIVVKEVRYNEVKEKKMDSSLDYSYWETVSYKIKYECKCNDCGFEFTEF